MSDIKKYLSLEGLGQYHRLITEYIGTADKKLEADLIDRIEKLDAKLGNWGSDNSDSDFVSVESAIVEINNLINKIREEGGKVDTKIETAINKIVGDLGELGEGKSLLTLVEIINSLSENTENISAISGRVTAVENSIAELGEETLGTVVSKVNSNYEAIEKLNGEVDVEGSVKNIAKSYADAAQSAAETTASADATSKANAALAAAEKYVNDLVKDAEGNVKFDEKGAAAKALADAQAYADGLADDYDPAGSAAQALADAKSDAATLYQVKGDYEIAGAADKAQAAAIEAAATDAQTKANAALADAKAYVVDNFDLKYDGNIIHIIGENGAKIGDGIDASAFVTEGILKDVEFAFVDGSESDSDESNNTTLRLTFDTDKGDKVIDIDFKDYVDIYRADGTSLSLDSTTNTFSIREVAADKTKLNSDITIAGGPLANNIAETGDEWPWTDSAGNKIIPQGKSMEEILTGLFLKVIEGTVSFGNVSWSPTIDKPTVTLSKSGTIEVGTKVKVTALSKGDFKKEKRSVKLTATQGYFDGDTYYSDKTKMFYSAESTSSGTETISCTWNDVATDIVVNETELVAAKEGINTLIATQSGLTATVSAIPTKTVNASTNTKTKLTDTTTGKKQVATFEETQETYTSNTLSNSNNAKVTAYYPIYTNGKAGSDGDASNETTLVEKDATKLGLVADNTPFYVNFAPMIDGGTGYRLLVKSGKTIKEAMALNTLNGNYEVDMLSSFVKAEGTVDKASGDTTFAYDVYEAKGSAGANAIRFKID